VYAMLNTPDVGFHVRTDVAPGTRTIAAGWQQLVLEAARRYDHGSVPQPRRSMTPVSLEYAHPVSLAEAMRRPSRRVPRWVFWSLGTVALLLAVGALGWWQLQRRSSENATTAAVAAKTTPFEASELVGPGDVPPTLVEGAPPTPPKSEWPVAPTIVCRLTID